MWTWRGECREFSPSFLHCDWKASGVEALVKEEGAGARPFEI